MKKILCTLASFVLTLSAFAQARAQADVSITSVSLSPVRGRPSTTINNPATLPATNQPGIKPNNTLALPENLKCSITVFSQNDDDANQTMMVVVLPVEVSVVSKPANATAYNAGGVSPFTGYLVFNLGNMAVGQSITVEFTFTKSVYGNKVGAYAYSATPDPNPANNYKDAVY